MSGPRIVDLRSDTVSRPTAAMRSAMAAAEVGDDCYRDDPTVAALEREVARLLAHEAAVFVPSGTMANQLAVALHARPGEVVAVPAAAHVLVHEDGSAARFAGVQLMPIGGRDRYDADDFEHLLEESATGWPRVAAAWLENTLGLAGGRVWPVAEVAAISARAREHGCRVHMDGARLWNAAVRLGCAPSEMARHVDSVSVCLSKGLGCPVGSLLVSSRETIARAVGLRHAFGGSLRQAGILAAAGLHALEHHRARLVDDHVRARRLHDALADLPWRAHEPETNIVLFDDAAAEETCARLSAAGVLCAPNRRKQIRLVVHLDVDDDDLEWAIETIRSTLTSRT